MFAIFLNVKVSCVCWLAEKLLLDSINLVQESRASMPPQINLKGCYSEPGC